MPPPSAPQHEWRDTLRSPALQVHAPRHSGNGEKRQDIRDVPHRRASSPACDRLRRGACGPWPGSIRFRASEIDAFSDFPHLRRAVHVGTRAVSHGAHKLAGLVEDLGAQVSQPIQFRAPSSISRRNTAASQSDSGLALPRAREPYSTTRSTDRARPDGLQDRCRHSAAGCMCNHQTYPHLLRAGLIPALFHACRRRSVIARTGIGRGPSITSQELCNKVFDRNQQFSFWFSVCGRPLSLVRRHDGRGPGGTALTAGLVAASRRRE